ncbi:hypothetical protein [Pseudokineococcus sp. 1T1Z-3]|uniref:hypothetical protein n=1 Tax=Pseudokineococcus sp. 1T1Z-3 TaxID=3132745 RepID=UPI0030AB522D
MAYLALLVPVLVLPVLIAMAAFEARCSDGSPLLRRRVPAQRTAPLALPAATTSEQASRSV